MKTRRAMRAAALVMFIIAVIAVLLECTGNQNISPYDFFASRLGLGDRAALWLFNAFIILMLLLVLLWRKRAEGYSRKRNAEAARKAYKEDPALDRGADARLRARIPFGRRSFKHDGGPVTELGQYPNGAMDIRRLLRRRPAALHFELRRLQGRQGMIP